VICIADRRYRPTGLASGEVSVYDKNGSKVLLKADGSIEIESKAKMTIKSVTGCVVEDAAGVQLKTGDAMTWMPNILKVDPFTGLPHGGPGAGIVLLTGG
jgi:phage gp45-like